MSVDEVLELVKCGMYAGSHGSMHYWLNRISPQEQEDDVMQSLNFLENVGASTKEWVMCYPHGVYNDTTLSLLHKYNASLGITTDVRVPYLNADNSFELPRVDTNDFPQ